MNTNPATNLTPTNVSNLYGTLLILNTPEEYKEHYNREYCNQKFYTHDGIEVSFFAETFEHAFYKSGNRRVKGDKSIFSPERAERMMWIKAVLMDDSLTSYQGYDSKKRRYDDSRRVTIVTPDNYVVVLKLRNGNKATFVTAYLCDDGDNTINKIKMSPVFLP